ncbi:4690_t:CDS:2, partial [Funneliformis caledonium]
MSEYEVDDDYDREIQNDDTNLMDLNLDFILNLSEMNLIRPEDLDKIGECSIKDKNLRAIKHHLLTEGLVEQQYENMKNLLKVTSHSLAIILLPTKKNYTRVYENFVITSRELDSYISVISYKSFIQLWKSLTPHVKFMTSV